MYTLRKTRALSVALALMLALLFGAFALFGGKPASAADPTDPGPSSGDGISPELILGNPDCKDLGYDYELKVDGAPNGTFSDQNDGAGFIQNGPLSVEIYGSDGTYFNFRNATFGVDAVIVKGGPAGDSYVYDPVRTLQTPPACADQSELSAEP